MVKKANSLVDWQTPQSLHRYAIACVVATWCLIFIGGLVTSTGSALAVPDWPLAFGHLVPRLVGGVRFEYGHRVAAAAVSVMTLGLAIGAARSEPRSWVRKLAIGAFALVIVQAGLGGITVLLELPLAIAVTHAATAQAFLCLIVALAVVTNPRFGTAASETALHPRLIVLTTVTTMAIYVQILLGAVMRHLGAGLAIPDFPLSYGRLIPPLDSGFVMINFAHRAGALAVSILTVWTVMAVMRGDRGDPWIRRPAIAIVVLLAIQITLGALTVWSGRAVIPTTAHVSTGAAVLATSLVLAIRVRALGASTGWHETARLRGLREASIEHQARA
jgi:cytochrome c oxidase assembly protein subunit 15